MGGGRGGGEVEECVVRGEVVSVVNACYVVKVGVLDEGKAVSVRSEMK